jgi:hypothetical protein
MKSEEIEITVGPDGTVDLQVKGVKGKRCLDLTKDLEDALGGDVEQRKHSAEYYETEATTQHVPSKNRTR